MIYTGKKAYDPLTNTYSTGYWIQDSQGYWYPVWNTGTNVESVGRGIPEESEG